MAREKGKEMQEVKSAADAIQGALAGADAAFIDILGSAKSVTDELQKSNKFSEDNKEAAKQIAEAMSSVAAVTQNNTKANRAALEEMRAQIIAQGKLDSNQQKLVNTVLQTAGATAENKSEAEGLEAAIARAEGGMKKIGVVTGLVGGAFALLVGLAKQIGERIDKIGNTFGAVAADTSFRQNLMLAGAEANALGFGIQDVISVTDALTSKFGVEFTPEVAKSAGLILDFAKGTGLSNDEATNLIGAMTAVTDLTIEQAAELGQGVFNLAKQANVAPTAVMKDLASSGEAFAKFSGGSVENLARAAVQARALGTSIDQVANAASNTLDFQSSVQAELEASVLLGRTINLQKAREAAQSKDLVGFQNEILKVLGTQEEFLEAAPQAQELLAKATGFTVQQVAELLDNTEKVESLSSRLAAGPGFAELVGADALSNITQFLNKIKEIGATILSELAPSFEGISERLMAFIESLGGAKGIADTIVGVFDTLGGAFTFIKDNLGSIIGMMVAFKAASIAIAIAQTTAAIATITGATLGVGTALAIAGILGGAMAVGGFLGSFHDLPEGQMAQGTGPNQLVNIDDTEAVAKISDIEKQEVHVHVDNTGIINEIKNLRVSIGTISRTDLEMVLKGALQV